MSTIDISTFETNNAFYGDLNIIITVKSFELQAIRKRYLESKKNSKVGSVERREPSLGGLVSMRLHDGQLKDEEVLSRMKEPRGIAFQENRIAYASENVIIVLHADGSRYEIENPWFSYVHTVDFSPYYEHHILISSSGFDCFFEYDYVQNKLVKEWFAWENGIYEAHDKEGNTIYITRKADQKEKWEREGKHVNFIQHPATDHLPTSQRAAFINSVYYHRSKEDSYVATLFHKGEVRKIDASGQEVLFSGLKSPHGGRMSDHEKIVVNTAKGTLMVNDVVYDFQFLAGKPEEMQDMEWLQNAIFLGNLVVVIDSNRTSFVLLDLNKKLKSVIPYNSNYAVQDLVRGSLSEAQLKAIATNA